MQQSKVACLYIVMLFFSVVMQTSATVIYDESFKKKSGGIKQVKSTNADLSIDGGLQASNLGVDFFDNDTRNIYSPITLAASYPNPQQTSALSLFYNAKIDAPYFMDWSEPAKCLLKTNDICNDSLFNTKTDSYFGAPTYSLESLNFLFWTSVVNHEDWGIVVAQDINPSNEPEPTSVGLLGVGIMSFATLQQRNKNRLA